MSTWPTYGAAEQERERELKRLYPDPCEYNPEAKRAAYGFEVHGPAEWIVGHDGKWRLCDSCARLPEFKRYRTRKRIERDETRQPRKPDVPDGAAE